MALERGLSAWTKLPSKVTRRLVLGASVAALGPAPGRWPRAPRRPPERSSPAGTHDSGRIVIDEVAGYLVTMALVDRSDAWTLGIGFVVFRAFDMIKPPPVRMIDEKMPGGWGVVLDDVAAGVMGAAVMWALAHWGALAALPR